MLACRSVQICLSLPSLRNRGQVQGHVSTLLMVGSLIVSLEEARGDFDIHITEDDFMHGHIAGGPTSKICALLTIRAEAEEEKSCPSLTVQQPVSYPSKEPTKSTIHIFSFWTNPRCNGKLPPGSMGLPLLGETFHFFSPNTTSDIPLFVKERMKRYGPIFRTSLVGRPVIVSTDPDLNRFIFQQEGKLFQSWYPDSFTEIFGRQNVGSLHGFMYRYLKNMVLNLIGPESLKKMLPEIEQAACRRLHQWSCEDSVELKEATASMIFDLSAKKLISYDPDKSSENLRENFDAFIQGLISFPLDIPGTAYHKCLQGRKKAMRMLKNMLQERREYPRKLQNDFFDYVLEELQRPGTILTEAIALDLMFVLLFASFETTSLAITLGMRFLSDHPLVLKQLTEEHEEILKSRENVDSGLTWKEYKSMKFTFQFINETVRLANIVPAIFRKSLRNIEFKGLTIPAGWAVMVCPPAVHLNPAVYEDPLSFNPWRWEGKEVQGASKHFMAFGGGMRFCVGTEFSKVQMAVFLHSLVTKYRWQTTKGGDIVRTPGLQFPNGFHIKLMQKETLNQQKNISI